MSTKDIAISVENISKLYRIGVKDEMRETFAATFMDFVKSPMSNYQKYRSLYDFEDVIDEQGRQHGEDKENILWAVKNVSFDVEQGEVLGIIGGNGAGKSTLLKMLSRITDPTTGKIELNGRVGSLLEVGTGFHPELTGRENIYLNGTILGMRKKEVDSKLDEIIDFSGVESFIDTPVKRYSSGMRVRLAFSVAAHLEPEVLIIDEVLAVGDAAFQKKCLDKMEGVGKAGRTVIFVSHIMPAVMSLCTRAIVLDRGQIILDGPTKDAVELYLRGTDHANEEGMPISERKDRDGRGLIQMVDFWIENEQGRKVTDVPCSEKITIKGVYKGAKPKSSLRFIFSVRDSHGQRITRFDTMVTGDVFEHWPDEGVVSCTLDGPIALGPEAYRLSFAVYDNNELEDHMYDAVRFHVIEGDFFGTGKMHQGKPLFLLGHSWDVSK